ncbi:hypothetical protein [Haloechinothrix alba]|nr:hypothetical protein [Haloechinothrix alba]
MFVNLRAFCRERLVHNGCPSSIEIIPGLPRGDDGKLYKKQLRS